MAWLIVVTLFVFAYFVTAFLPIAKAILLLVSCIVLLDYVLLFLLGGSIYAHRVVPDFLSNGDENEIHIRIVNKYKIPITLEIIDELPFQFQKRDFSIIEEIKATSKKNLQYTLTPKERGVYEFGNLLIYTSSKLGFLQKRYTAENTKAIKVYPSFVHLKKYALKSLADRKTNGGNKTMLRRGFSTEFDHIKEYNRGDDARLINWKASARRNQLMINSFMEEKSQNIYCLIDKGRLMKMPFNGLSLLDYAINATLMFSYVSIQKNDKVGLVSFNEKVNDVLPPAKTRKQFNNILETLYKQRSNYLDSDFAALYRHLNRKTGHRGLMLLFTNFETYSGFERQLPYLKAINSKELLCVVLFENIELSSIEKNRGDNLEDIYIKTIADKFMMEKRLIVKELQKNGIMSILSTPSKLSIDVVNKYLELKSSNVI